MKETMQLVNENEKMKMLEGLAGLRHAQIGHTHFIKGKREDGRWVVFFSYPNDSGECLSLILFVEPSIDAGWEEFKLTD